MVRDAGGAPLADAAVRATPSEYFSASSTVVAKTAADGRFTLAGVDRSAYDVSAEAADHLRAVREQVRGGTHDVELSLDAGRPLAGEVVDKRGEPSRRSRWSCNATSVSRARTSRRWR